jgi:hypothetical protein
MDRRGLAARILRIDGVLLLVVAAIHLGATPLALNFVQSQVAPDAFAQIKPAFLLSFVVVGILLIPVGLSMFYSARLMLRGEVWGRTICLFDGIAIAMLPLALVSAVPARYFHAKPFLAAAFLVCVVAVSVVLALFLSSSESRQ